MRTITGPLRHPVSNTLMPDARFSISTAQTFAGASATYPRDFVTVTTDENAQFSIVVATPASGTVAYAFSFPGVDDLILNIGDGPDTTLHALIAAQASAVAPSALQAHADTIASESQLGHIRAHADQIDGDGFLTISGGGGGAVASVNGQIGVVVLGAADVGADASGTAAGAVASEATARASADSTEASARSSADTTLATNIASEATARASADTANASAISTHTARTDNPHSVTAAQAGADPSGTAAGLLTTHAALTTAAHGGIVASTDPRLTDSRTPTAHALSGGLHSGTLGAAQFDDTAHGARAGGALHAVATGSVAGFASAADKTKLDGIASGATANAGTVTSVGMTVPGVLFSVSGSPITSAGSLAMSLLNQAANTVLAGPSSGGAASPTLRALVALDIPALAFSSLTGIPVTLAGYGIIDAAALAGANVFSAAQTINRNGIGSTSTDGLLLANTTAAAAGAQQWSPRLHLAGRGWATTGSTSQAVEWIVETVPVQGAANPSSSLSFSSQINGGGYGSRMTLYDTGALSVPSNITAQSGAFTLTNLWTINAAQNRSASSMLVGWASTTNNSTVIDAGFARNAAGVVEVNTGTAGQWGSLKAGARDAGTATIVDGLALGHQTSATPAAGLGIGVALNINSTTAADQSAGRIAAAWSDATHATRTAYLALSTTLAGIVAERARVDAGNGANTTGLMLWDVNSGALKRVEVGAVDSGGSGYRALRVAN